MSKRYGRNQRRHHREEIANLTRREKEMASRADSYRLEAGRLRGRLEAWAHDIYSMLGADSAFNEQIRRMTTHDTVPNLQLMPTMRLDPVSFGSRGQLFANVDTVINAAIYRVRLKSDDLRRQIRILVESQNGDVGFAMNSERHKRWSPRDVACIADMIARDMARHLERQGLLDDERKHA